jgi:hypothetical protein
MRYFCTYFDRHYLSRGLALHASLTLHCAAFKLWVLCLDQATFDTLSRMQLPGLEPIAVDELEAYDQRLAAVRPDRSPVEYYFTCTPSLPIFLFDRRPDVDLLTYLDADLFFFASPEPVFEEIGSASIAIIEHRFPHHLRHFERYGIYNVGWVSFRRDATGQECLRWWRERCIEWCYDRCEDGRFADQKYLDDWPRRFPNVVSLKHDGANLAPWNVMRYRVETAGGRLLVDGTPVIFFHFHGFRRLTRWLCDTNLGIYGATATRLIRRRVYRPYVAALASAVAAVERCTGKRLVDTRQRYSGLTWRPVEPWSPAREIARRLGQVLHAMKSVRQGHYVITLRPGRAQL